MKSRKREVFLFTLLAAGILAQQAALTRRWVREDAQPPAWDPSVHLGTAMDYRDAWREGRWLDLLLTKPRPGHPPYPPLYDYTAIPALSSARPHIAVAWLNLGYWSILVFSSAWIAWELAGVRAAAAALAAMGLSHGLALQFPEAFPDFALAAWVTSAYALLLASKLYESRGKSIGVGLCAALAMNSKWGAFLYLLPAVLPGLKTPARRRNLALAAAVAALGCLPWYLVNGIPMLPRIWASVTLGHHQGQPLTWTRANWWFYPDFLVRCFSWPGFLLLLAGCAAALASPRGRAGVWIAAWLGFSYLFCTAVPSKDWRYFLPAAAALPSLGASGLPVPGLAAAFLLAFYHPDGSRRPKPGDWHNGDILAAVERRRDPARSLSTLCVLPNHRDMNATALGWQARHAGLGRIAAGGQQSEIPEWSDFVLAKTGDPGAFLSDETYRILAQAKEKKGLFSRVFREAARWPLPDGSEAVLYEQRPHLPLLARTRFYPSIRVRSAHLEGVRLKPQGRDRYEITVSTLTLDKLPAPVRGIRVLLEGARLVEDSGKVYILGINTVTLESADASWERVSAALSARCHLPVNVGGEDGGVTVGIAGLKLTFKISQENHLLRISVPEAQWAGIPFPGTARLRWNASLAPAPPYQPYTLVLRPIHILQDGLRIGL